MKAMILSRHSAIENKPLTMADLLIPHLGRDQILVKVSVCGICHTDLDIAEGRLKPPRLPVVPGHQIVGIIADKGKNATRFKKGDRVGITWLYSNCGKCGFCSAGNENLCESAKWTGKDVNGGYAESRTNRRPCYQHLRADCLSRHRQPTGNKRLEVLK